MLKLPFLLFFFSPRLFFRFLLPGFYYLDSGQCDWVVEGRIGNVGGNDQSVTALMSSVGCLIGIGKNCCFFKEGCLRFSWILFFDVFFPPFHQLLNYGVCRTVLECFTATSLFCRNRRGSLDIWSVCTGSFYAFFVLTPTLAKIGALLLRHLKARKLGFRGSPKSA